MILSEQKTPSSNVCISMSNELNNVFIDDNLFIKKIIIPGVMLFYERKEWNGAERDFAVVSVVEK